jgi:hypothetical protein
VSDTVATEVEIAGKRLVCPVCEGTYFTQRRSLLNTRMLTLFNADWANRSATNHVCAACGYIFWFMNR